MSINVRVLVVEDHPMMADAMKASLVNAGATVVGACGTARECMSLYATESPDVVVCDVGLGSGNTGVDLTKELLAQHPSARVLMFSGYDNQELVQAAIDAGACGYINKQAGSADLIDGIQAAAAGETEIFDRQTSRAFIASLKRQVVPQAKNPKKLTPREQQVLELLAEDDFPASTKDIAKRLSVSPQTVKSHLENIMGKLGATNRLHVVKIARAEGLLQPASDEVRVPSTP